MWIAAALLFLPFCTALPHVSTRSTPGCGKTHLFPGVTQYRFNLVSSDKSRSYSYHLPANYDPNKEYPAVLGFHGSSSTGLFFELDTKMSEKRFSEEKIMVYPNGIGGSWAGPSYHEGSSVEEDIQFVQDVVRDLEERACVDVSRIYAVGYVRYNFPFLFCKHGTSFLLGL
jgi:poly(3-hydroxybutyrate) depolymerase